MSSVSVLVCLQTIWTNLRRQWTNLCRPPGHTYVTTSCIFKYWISSILVQVKQIVVRSSQAGLEKVGTRWEKTIVRNSIRWFWLLHNNILATLNTTILLLEKYFWTRTDRRTIYCYIWLVFSLVRLVTFKAKLCSKNISTKKKKEVNK